MDASALSSAAAAPGAAEPLLVVRNLETWYGPISAIKGVNLELHRGSIVTVLGANGAGKTTLLNTVAGVIDPFKGSVHFLGEPIHGLDPDAVARRGLVLVPEGRQVFPFLTVAENLRMGAFARREKQGVDEDIERVYAWFPRLRERAQQPGGLLSGKRLPRNSLSLTCDAASHAPPKPHANANVKTCISSGVISVTNGIA